MKSNSSSRHLDIIKNSTNIIKGDEYRQIINAVAKTAADMVVRTLGPYGTTTVLDDGTGTTYLTKDGWSSINHLHFKDALYNSVFGVIKQVSMNNVVTVGDGTTTAMVTASNFLNLFDDFIEDYKSKLNSYYTQFKLTEDIKICTEAVIEGLLSNPNIKHVNDDDYNEIATIAEIATNGNKYFGEIISEIYRQTGGVPDIRVEQDVTTSETYFEIQNGYKFRAVIPNRFAYVTSEGNRIINTRRNVQTLIFNHPVNHQSHGFIINMAISEVSSTGGELYIIAPYFDEMITGAVAANVSKLAKDGYLPSIMLVQVPSGSEEQALVYKDLSLLMNCQILSNDHVKYFNIISHNEKMKSAGSLDKIVTIEEEPLLGLDIFKTMQTPASVITSHFGKINHIEFDKTHGFLRNFENIANMTEYNKLLKICEEEFAELKVKSAKTIGGKINKDYLKKQARYSQLKGKAGIIYVGGVSEMQRMCDKDAMDDAVLACRSAYENGYGRGMNLEVMSVITNLMGSADYTPAQLVILELINTSFYNTVLEIFKSKYCVNDPTHIIDSYTAPDGDVYDYSVQDLLNELVTNDEPCCVNIRTNTISDRDNWDVINSVSTDIEIVKAITSILVTVMTSAQYLTVNRNCDTIATREAEIKERLKDELHITEETAKVQAEVYGKAFENAMRKSLTHSLTHSLANVINNTEIDVNGIHISSSFMNSLSDECFDDGEDEEEYYDDEE